MKKILITQVIFILILAGLLLMYRQGKVQQSVIAVLPSANLQPDRSGYDKYDLINPAVRADLGKHYIINFKDLRSKLIELQKKQSDKHFLYFAYLNNSSWIGLGEKELFPAASTVKVPLAMALYKMEEQGKIKLSKTYTLSELDLDTNFGELYKAGPDQSFTIEELIGIMLKYSDNTAMKAVINITELIGVKDPLKDIYLAMGWEYSNVSKEEVTYIKINLKTLTNMFIALYNGSYISIENSQKVLKYLSGTDFNSMIVAGIPKDVVVSHKIGVNDIELAYSDCGIVYAPNRPYIMCAGSVGATPKEANAFMAETSKAVYEYVINN